MVAADFIGKTVCLDTAPFIYFIEGDSQYYAGLLPLFKENVAGNVPFITSSITLLEVLVKPLRDGDFATAQYKEILTNSPTLRLFDVDVVIAEEAARLRAMYNFRTPDAIQLAVAIIHGADYFLTNDKGLKKAGEIKVMMDELG